MIENQLNHYKAAVGHKNRGSEASRGTMRRAKNTAIGADRAITTSARGSWEGLQYAPSTTIAMEGSGYHAPANQTFRNAHKAMRARGLMAPGMGGSSPVSRSAQITRNVFDHRLNAGSSISRLRKLMRVF